MATTPHKHQLYGHLPSITKTILVRRTRHAGHCWRSKDELISDVLLWTPTYGQAKAGRAARTYIEQLCEDTGCNPEYLPKAMNDREKWRERVRDIRAGGKTWWGWYIYIYIYIYIRGAFNKFPDFFLYRHLKLSKTLEKYCYCYTSYEMTDQFLWVQVQMNSYSSNWNTPD